MATTRVAPTTKSESVADELSAKLAIVRETLEQQRLDGIRLRGHDWFAWLTCGGSNAVLLASEHGVGEVFVTADGARVLTDAIEAGRLRAEEVPNGLEVVEFGWERPDVRERYVREATGRGRVASDMPADGELGLPSAIVAEKRRLRPAEVARYREVGRDAAAAMTETIEHARPEATEFEIAGIGAAALFRRGIEPALVLVAGSRRLDLYRHPRPTAEPIGERLTVVFCGRRSGLYANLTRFGYFREPTEAERSAARVVAQVEAVAWNASRPGATLADAYAAIASEYARLGHPGAELGHHQGGMTGYLSREVVATPDTAVEIVPTAALAWNPSLPGSKIEDTVLRAADRLEILTVDPAWPTVEVDGRPRPDLRIVG
jgi:Xaa-Pro aminopeptidase